MDTTDILPDQMLPDDFLSWILLDMDSRANMQHLEAAPLVIAESAVDNPSYVQIPSLLMNPNVMHQSKQVNSAQVVPQGHPVYHPVAQVDIPVANRSYAQPPMSKHDFNEIDSFNSADGIDMDSSLTDSTDFFDSKAMLDAHQDVVGQKRKQPRNRDLAKACRKRQRDKLDELEMKIKMLADENKELQAHVNNVTQRTTEVQRQRIEMERLMKQKVEQMEGSSTQTGPEIDALVKKFVALYSDYGEYRGREVSFHLDQLEKLVVPTSTTKFCIWTLQQGESNSNEAKSSLFSTLSRELEILPEQLNAVRGRKYVL